MKREDVSTKLDLAEENGGWYPVECFKKGDGTRHAVKLHNTIFSQEHECCVLRFAVGGHGFDLHINSAAAENKLNFKVFYDLNSQSFESNDLNECLSKVKEWFATISKSENE